MDKATLLKSLRAINAMLERGHGKQSLGLLISSIQKPRKNINDALATRKQLLMSAQSWMDKHKSKAVHTSQEQAAMDIIMQFVEEEDNYVVERDTKKQLAIIVHAQVNNLMNLHPDYFTKKGHSAFNPSLTKRLIGDIFAYMKRMAARDAFRS